MKKIVLIVCLVIIIGSLFGIKPFRPGDYYGTGDDSSWGLRVYKDNRIAWLWDGRLCSDQLYYDFDPDTGELRTLFYNGDYCATNIAAYEDISSSDYLRGKTPIIKIWFYAEGRWIYLYYR